MSYTNIECLRARAEFPALDRQVNGHPIAFLDGPGGTQVPNCVLEAITAAYVERNANFDGQFATSRQVGLAVAEARHAVADLIGASNGSEISFGANMTTLNFSLSRALGRDLKPGDEVVITELDHEANRGPWLRLRDHGVVVREIKLNPSGHLDEEDFARQISPRTRIFAMGLASNALGSVPPLVKAKEICEKIGAKLVVDAVHYAAHFPVDVDALGVDFLLCSAYKFYGPHIGILYARDGLLDKIDTDHLRTQKSHAPYRIETGTLNHAAIAGVTAAVEYISQWGSGSSRRERLLSAMADIHDYEVELARYYYESLHSISGVQVWGPAFDGAPRAPTVSLSMDGHRPETIASVLGDSGLQVWHGHFYALKVLEVLQLVDSGGLLRVGISMYNTRAEIDRLLQSLAKIANEEG